MLWAWLIAVILLVCSATIDEEYPTIQEIMPFFSSDMAMSPLPPNYTMDNFHVNVKELDLAKFRRKMLRGFNDFMNNSLLYNVSLTNDTRRQQLPYTGPNQFKIASTHLVNLKLFDLSAQLIFMARHIVRELKEDKYFNTQDTGYRIAFVSKKLKAIRDRMYHIRTNCYRRAQRMYHDQNLGGNWWIGEYVLNMHLRTIRLHTDFVYMWWVMVRLDGAYSVMMNETKRDVDLDNILATTYFAKFAEEQYIWLNHDWEWGR